MLAKTFAVCLGFCIALESFARISAQETANPESAIDVVAAQRAFHEWRKNLFRPVKPEPTKEPEWSPLDPKVDEWVDEMLAHWEKRNKEFKSLQCEFECWEYDPAALPTLVKELKAAGKIREMPFNRYAKGQFKYAPPNKALYKVELEQVAYRRVDQTLMFQVSPRESHAHIITDGKRQFIFDPLKKRILEWSNEEMSPFLRDWQFSPPSFLQATAKELKEQYWIRPLQGEKGEYCLEAIPKMRREKVDFQLVQIVLDEKTFLPTRMQLFESDWTPDNPHRTAYKFRNVRENDAGFDLAVFSDVPTPPGWGRQVFPDLRYER